LFKERERNARQIKRMSGWIGGSAMNKGGKLRQTGSCQEADAGNNGRNRDGGRCEERGAPVWMCEESEWAYSARVINGAFLPRDPEAIRRRSLFQIKFAIPVRLLCGQFLTTADPFNRAWKTAWVGTLKALELILQELKGYISEAFHDTIQTNIKNRSRILNQRPKSFA
jgi:hypothetical protein